MTTRIVPAAMVVLLATSCATSHSHAVGSRGAGLDDDVFAITTERTPSVRTLHATARILADQGRDGECEIVLTTLVETHPDYLPGWNELAELHLRHGRFDAAFTVLNAGLDRDPDDGVLRNNLGMCHLLRGELEEALEAFTRAAENGPDEVRSRANMAVTLGMLGRDDEARALFFQVLPIQDSERNLAILQEARS